MASTGFTTVATGANVGTPTAWSNPGNITADDGVNAQVDLGAFGNSMYLRGTNVSSATNAIGASDTIDGIEARWQIQASGTNCHHTNGYLVKAGTQVGSNVGPGVGQSLPTSMTNQTFGGPTNKWGTTWSVAQVKATNFGFENSVGTSTSSARSMYSDVYFINVYYTPSFQMPPVAMNHYRRRRG
jgi:hypothetical protein